MKKTVIAAVAAIGKNRVLGSGNRLLWHIPDDLKRFKALTQGHPLILGRKTHESILEYTGGKPLQGRKTIVISRDTTQNVEGAIVASSLEDAIQRGRELDSELICIGGGAQIYAAALPYTNRLHLTLIDDEKEGDAFFPPYEEKASPSFSSSMSVRRKATPFFRPTKKCLRKYCTKKRTSGMAYGIGLWILSDHDEPYISRATVPTPLALFKDWSFDDRPLRGGFALRDYWFYRCGPRRTQCRLYRRFCGSRRCSSAPASAPKTLWGSERCRYLACASRGGKHRHVCLPRLLHGQPLGTRRVPHALVRHERFLLFVCQCDEIRCH